MTEFFQTGPELSNQYKGDRLLRTTLQRLLPDPMLSEIEPDLVRIGEQAVDELLNWADEAERNQPEHVPFDPWGKRIDTIETSRAWEDLKAFSAREGLVATAFEREHGPHSRIHQLALLHLFHPSSAVYSCPLAMTDGAARVIERYGDEGLASAMQPHLLSREPAEFWTSGQWMTERSGGSDVGGTETIARPDGDGYRLHGTKWFTSATTSEVAFTLARIEGDTAGSRGLSLFGLKVHDEDGNLNQITVHRLKDKLGTKALPTAELTLNGTPATLVGGRGDGVRKIATILNITRFHNAVAATSIMRRGLALARDYAQKRSAFGKKLADHPLHLEALSEMAVEQAAGFQLVVEIARLLGLEETGQASEQEKGLLRLLTPVAKLYTAKQAIRVTAEVMESFGGAGYVEDTGIPRMVRDAHVLSIWEGTTNVLSLDVFRAIAKEKAFDHFHSEWTRRVDELTDERLAPVQAAVREALEALTAHLKSVQHAGRDILEAGARSFAYGVARTMATLLMAEHADWALAKLGDKTHLRTVLRWIENRDLAPVTVLDEDHLDTSRSLALGEAQVAQTALEGAD